jgi:hypothetical protein
MGMNSTYLNSIATHGSGLITHIGLVNAAGEEISGGTPPYARKAITWTAPVAGLVRPTEDLVFFIPAGANVAGWRCFSAVTGGTNFGGSDLIQESYASAGEYKLLAATSGISHTVA